MMPGPEPTALTQRQTLMKKINHCGAMRIRFRFVLMAKVNGLEQLWTI
jgi:hypothetical protein